MEYRREIDGLRAIAVLPVILFHAGIGLFPGGFVGVDVFFVLSGYLITSILLSELAADRYSIGKFYERRIRRIVPALFLVVAATVPFAWLWMTPEQFKEMGGSIVSIIAFCSNIFFWSQTDYFAGSSELKPFLHTWSLAVEEQYYVLFPLFLAFVWRWQKRLILPLLLAGTLASLALSEWASFRYESGNFFLAPTRAWELLVGAICAFILTRRSLVPIGTPTQRSALAAFGLGAIAYAILFYNDQMRFPGLSALVPVGGTALIVLFGTKDTLVARLLSVRGLVGIGLVSYSAYLWHQPLFALARLRSETEPPAVLMLALAVASLVLAWFSWRYVEQPFRISGRSFANTRGRVFATSGIAGVALIGVGAVIAHTAPPTQMALAQPRLFAKVATRAYEPQGVYSDCPGFQKTDRATCRQVGDGPRRVVIWGDSHANALSAGVSPVPGYSIIVLGQWGCPPLLGVARYDGFGNASNCSAVDAADGFAAYVASLKPEAVFLIARWTLYTNGRHFQSRLQRDTYFLTDGRPDPDGAETSRAVMQTGLGRTVDRLRAGGAHVYVIQQVPDLHDYSPRGLILRRAVPRAAIERWHAPEAIILAEARRHGATLVTTHDLFCGKDACALRTGDLPLYIDDNHLTFYGASRVFNRLSAAVTTPPS